MQLMQMERFDPVHGTWFDLNCDLSPFLNKDHSKCCLGAFLSFHCETRNESRTLLSTCFPSFGNSNFKSFSKNMQISGNLVFKTVNSKRNKHTLNERSLTSLNIEDEKNIILTYKGTRLREYTQPHTNTHTRDCRHCPQFPGDGRSFRRQ